MECACTYVGTQWGDVEYGTQWGDVECVAGTQWGDVEYVGTQWGDVEYAGTQWGDVEYVGTQWGDVEYVGTQGGDVDVLYYCLQRTYWYRPAHPVGVAKATPLSNPNGLLIQYDVWDGGGGGGTFLGETPPFGSV